MNEIPLRNRKTGRSVRGIFRCTRLYLFPVFNAEVIQNCLEIILHQQTGVTEVTREFVPLFQTTIIEHLVPVIDDERDKSSMLMVLSKFTDIPGAGR